MGNINSDNWKNYYYFKYEENCIKQFYKRYGCMASDTIRGLKKEMNERYLNWIWVYYICS